MTTDKMGGPAFPVICENGLGHITDGMTLWDWYAAHCPESYLERMKEMGVIAATCKYADTMVANSLRKREDES